MGFDLESVVKANSEWNSQKIIVSGVQGLGKSMFGSTFDSAIVARTEDGMAAIDVATFPELITSFQGIESVITALHENHNYKTLILDSLDWLEPIVWAQTCESHGETSIEGFGYGKGYTEALTQWRHLMGGLDSLRFNKGMAVVLIAHVEVKRYDSPEMDPYDRYQIKLHKHAAALWQEWADMVLFCNYKTNIEKTDVGFNKEVKRGTGKGERVIYTEERPAYLAKNRWGLPPDIYIGQDKTWSAFHQALNVATDGRYELPTQKEIEENGD